MKKQVLKSVLILLSIVLSTTVFSQTVQLCIKVNGVNLPVNRIANMCTANTVTPNSLSEVTLSATNCAATPETNITTKWKNLDVAPYTDSLDNVITAQKVGRWEVRITNNVTLAITKDTVFLSYYPVISITMNDAAYTGLAPVGCPLYVFNLTSNPVGPITGYKWFTYPAQVLIPGATASSVNIPKRNSFYIVEVNDVNGCVVADTSTNYFTQLPTLNVDVGLDPAIFCEGNTYNLGSYVTPVNPPGGAFTPYISYWGYKQGNTVVNLGSKTVTGVPAGQSNIISPPEVVTPPAGTSRYFIRVSKFPYCDNADTVVITTKPIPVVDIGPASKMVCYGSDSTLTSTISLGTAPFVYTWTSVPAGSYPATASIQITPSVPTTYTLNVSDVNSCGTGTDNIAITINPQIVTSVSNDTTICRIPAGTASLIATATGGVGALTYAWLPATGLSSTSILNPLATPILPSFIPQTTYTFNAIDVNNCPSLNETVTVNYFAPSIAAIAEPAIISETKSVVLDASNAANVGFNFQWKTDASSTILSLFPSLSLEYQGPDTNFYVVIVSSNYTNPSQLPLNGCSNSDTIEVRSISDNTLLYVPNVFSPNAFDAENQKFKIYGDNLLDEGFKILVYNKWGNLMYESTNLGETKSAGWDGGAKIEGVYTYVIVGKFKNGKDVKESPFYKGTFSLIK